MKFKPKEILVNLPTILTFSYEDEIIQQAAAFNAFVHGKVKLKYEILGLLGGQAVGLFYIQRDADSQKLREEFVAAINQEEEEAHARKYAASARQTYCRQVPECECGVCRDPYGGMKP
jgi:hypothetical protein